MQSKSILDLKSNKHPFMGESVLFATKHRKEEIIAPLLLDIGMNCIRAEIDTDQFGTFSGEVERSGSVRDTLRKKIKKASSLYPEGRFILASEGSFGPHPIFGFLQTDLECLLLWDREQNLEIYSEYLDTQPVHAQETIRRREDVRSVYEKLQFPSHHVIIHPENFLVPIFKGLQTENEVFEALEFCFADEKVKGVVISNDLRACHNPRRQQAIREAGLLLLEKMKTFCPTCGYPGYAVARGVPGLPCIDCGEPSSVSKSVVFECVNCTFTEEKNRPDGKKFIDPSECEFCNP